MLQEPRLSGKGDATLQPLDVLKDPFILEFLDLPDSPKLHESNLESAIIEKLQHFLLALGRGFSFVARQKRMRLEDEDFYVRNELPSGAAIFLSPNWSRRCM